MKKPIMDANHAWSSLDAALIEITGAVWSSGPSTESAGEQCFPLEMMRTWGRKARYAVSLGYVGPALRAAGVNVPMPMPAEAALECIERGARRPAPILFKTRVQDLRVLRAITPSVFAGLSEEAKLLLLLALAEALASVADAVGGPDVGAPAGTAVASASRSPAERSNGVRRRDRRSPRGSGSN